MHAQTTELVGSLSDGSPLHIGPVQAGAAVYNATLYRLASVAGVGSAFILLVNAAKRSALIRPPI